MVLLTMVSAALAVAPPVGDGREAGNVLWDNGPPDNSNGYSNATADVFGSRRTVLDDFTVPVDQTWLVEEFHWEHIWNSFPPGSGTGLEIILRADADGAPGEPITPAPDITGYREKGTGVTYFNRPGAESWVTFEPFILDPGTYWFEATIVGPENDFWLVHTDVIGSECWVNYDDLGGLQPGTKIFGVPADLSFRVVGTACLGAETVLPERFSFAGTLVEGGLEDLFESDDERVVIRNRPPPSIRAPAIELEVEGIAPAAPLLSLIFRVEASSTARPPRVPQRIELFNFTSGAWDQFDERFATLEDSMVEVLIASDVDRYVEGATRRLLARVRWFSPGDVVNASWTAAIDQAVWALAPDCNGNGLPDGCDIDGGTSADCNLNGRPDECDIAGGGSEDINRNGVPDECECIGDVTGNGRVDFADILDIMSAWGECTGCDEDTNGDGVVDTADLLFVLASWGPCDAAGPPA